MPFFDVNDLRLHYEEAGRGQAVLLAHGGGGDWTQWRHQISVLAKSYRVIAFDARGHGESSVGNDCYGIKALVDDVEGLMKHLGIERAHLIGATLGGVTALELALAHPQRVRTLVVVSTAPDATEEMRARFSASATVIESGDLAGFAEGYIHFIFSPAYVAAHPDEVTDFRRRLEKINPVGYARAMGVLAERADLSPRLGSLAIPTLVVTGELDPIPSSAPGAEVLGRSLPNARVVIVPEAAHLPQIEQPAAFNRLILDFLGAEEREAA